MNKIMTGAFALGLLLTATSCGSDEKKADTTTTVATADSTDATATDVTATDATTGGDVAGLGTLQAQVLAVTLAGIAETGATADEACLTAVVAQMSDADAQLVIDAGPTGSPTLSAEGEALGPQAAACVTSDVTTPAT